MSTPVNNLRTGTARQISKSFSISFLFFPSRTFKHLAHLAYFVRLTTYPVETMILEVYSIMRFRTAVSIATFFLFCFAISLWSVPVPVEFGPLPNSPEPTSVSGTIANVNTSQFTLSLNRNQSPNKLEFVIDSNTKIEGRLAVGSQATVDYRAEGQQLVATHVVVLPASGIQLY